MSSQTEAAGSGGRQHLPVTELPLRKKKELHPKETYSVLNESNHTPGIYRDVSSLPIMAYRPSISTFIEIFVNFSVVSFTTAQGHFSRHQFLNISGLQSLQ
jgi:hypothetical protein